MTPDAPAPAAARRRPNWPALAGLVIFSLLAGLLSWLRLSAHLDRRPEAGPGPRETAHPVTAGMIAGARSASGRPAPRFEAAAADGHVYTPSALAGRPAVLLFIKRGCPCSETAQPLFNRLHAAYGDSARFLGVIDGEVSSARAWGGLFDVPFPILADPDGRVVRAFGVENSAYHTLITPDGQVAELWPGYSAESLADLGRRLAGFAGRPPAKIDLSDAPAAMYSGCPYEWAAAADESEE